MKSERRPFPPPACQSGLALEGGFAVFHELMARKVRDILLVLNPYDAFVMEENGSLPSRIVNEYRGLNLSHPPRMTRVASITEALRLLKSRSFDLLVTTPRVEDQECRDFAPRLKKAAPDLPLVLLSHTLGGSPGFAAHEQPAAIDRHYVWSADPELLLAIVKNIEDHNNVEADTRRAMVRVLLVVEDSPFYRSLILPLLYKEIVRQTQRILHEGLNWEHRLLKMRARPKILLAANYEEALELYHRFRPYLLGVLADTRFPRRHGLDAGAGLRLLAHIRREVPDMPLLLMSAEEGNRQRAEKIPAVFLSKHDPDPATAIRSFLLSYLGFGDFVFRRPTGEVAGSAASLREFEEKLKNIDDDSLLYHAASNHFSHWIAARAEIGLAARLHRDCLGSLDDAGLLRRTLIREVHSLRRSRQQGVVSRFNRDDFDPEVADFLKSGEGSLGGKGLGLAFLAAQLARRPELAARYPDLRLAVPRTLVLTSEHFDLFAASHELEKITSGLADHDIALLCRGLPLPEALRKDLAAFLERVNTPLSVRSSSLQEDAHGRPYAGLFETYMLANNQPSLEARLEQLLDAVRLVYASAFYAGPRAFARASGTDAEPGAMAVIIQELIGRRHGAFFYPALSGVAQSYNYYPIEGMRPEEGIAHLALGFGKTVVEGERCLRFSPQHPQRLPQFSTVDDILTNSQRSFYALGMSESHGALPIGGSNLTRRDLEEAAGELPVELLTSTYDPAEHRIRDGSGPGGPRVLTFARILKHDLFPLAAILRDMLELGRQGMGGGIEIEFVAEPGAGDTPPSFHLLQIRPMVAEGERFEVSTGPVEQQAAFCFSNQALGYGRKTLSDIVLVRPDRFELSAARTIAAEIAAFNARLAASRSPYLLIGPGRWGSADPFLGIPVRWEDISGVAAMVELRTDFLAVAPSEGTHFFQNMTAMGIFYFTVDETTGVNAGSHLDHSWLHSLPQVEKTPHLVHLRAEKPFTITVDGRLSKGVMLAAGEPTSSPRPQAGRRTTRRGDKKK